MLKDKIILVTGGTGSFGKAFINECLSHHEPAKLIIYSRDENKQFHLAKELSNSFPDMKHKVRFFIGDVRDASRIKMAFREVDYVIHAAALKHVPIAEYNPFECINTNVIGSQNVITAALETGVKKVVALSTDKACNPINLYGASKLASDKIFVAANNLSGSLDTRFTVVRYGNVIGSRGSVIPFFNDLIKRGHDTLPVTDDRMTRFWITLDQGVKFVLSCLEKMTGAEIFVPKIPSMRVIDIAKYMYPGCKIEIVGIRPGEKLHETMISIDDARHTFDLGDRYVILPAEFQLEQYQSLLLDSSQVPQDFSYSSDINNQWLNESDFQKITAGQF